MSGCDYVLSTASFDEWKKQLGTCMIDYDTLTIQDMIAKGYIIKLLKLFAYIQIHKCN